MKKTVIIGTSDTIVDLWRAVLKRGKELREGQALMNKLLILDPGMHEVISNTKNDCFYSDLIMPETIEYLARLYKE